MGRREGGRTEGKLRDSDHEEGGRESRKYGERRELIHLLGSFPPTDINANRRIVRATSRNVEGCM